MIKNVIFDFDGTIADSLPVVLKIINRMSPEYGYKAVEMEEVALWRAKTSRQIIAELKIPKIKIPFILAKILQELNASIDDVKVQKNIPQVLIKLKKAGYHLFLISSNRKDNIGSFLRNNQIDLFEEIESGVALFGKEKKIDNLLRKINGLKSETVYIGDETRDIEAAKKARVKSLAVCWGYNTGSALMLLNPDALIEKPEKIPEKIRAL